MDIDRLQIQKIVRDVANTTLLPLFNNVSREYKIDGSIVTQADKAVQAELTLRLASICPDVILLGEEMSTAEQQAALDSPQPVWCVDPVDGTSNFTAGLPFFCISLALIIEGVVEFGIVLDPIRDESFTAIKGQGAWFNDEPLTLKDSNLELHQSLAFIDYKRLSAETSSKLMTKRAYATQRNYGSIALELCWLALGRGHVYLRGGQYLWDYIAAELIFTEAGGFICTLEGEPLFNHTLEARSACAAINNHLFSQWCYYLEVPTDGKL